MTVEGTRRWWSRGSWGSPRGRPPLHASSRSWVIPVLAWLLAGCTAAAAAQPASDPAQDPRAVAARQYLELAQPLNARIAALGSSVDAARTIDDVRRISRVYADVHEQFAAGLAAIPFPSDVMDEVASAIAAVRGVAELNRQVSERPPDEMLAAQRELTDALDVQRARLVVLRAALGLGPPPRG